MTFNRSSFALASAVALFASTGLASAQSVSVGNASFQSPDVSANGTNYSQFPTDTGGVFGAWEQFNTSFKAVYLTSRYGGTLTNAPGSNGVDGTQAATISGTANGGGIFEEVSGNYAGTDPLQTFQAGYTYTLTVGIGRRADSAAALGTQITLHLFSRQADQGGATLLTSVPLTVGTTPGLETTTSGVLTDYTTSYTVPVGSASIGKPIGIFFDITSPSNLTGNQGDFAIDNVRVTAAVPEPATISLLGLGLLGLMGGIWARRQRA